MRRLKCFTVFLYLLLIFDTGNAFNIIAVDKQMLYEYVGTIIVGAKPQDEGYPAPPTTGWIVHGKLTIQRQTADTLAASLVIDDVTLNNSGDMFTQNKEMYPTYKPFKIKLAADGSIEHLVFKDSDPIWSTNFKRAIAAMLNFKMKPEGAFVINEVGIHGECPTEYYISNKTNYISIRKTPELKECRPFKEAVHKTRSNVPPNLCEFDFQKSVIVGNEALYGLLPHEETGYFLSMAHVKGTTLVHTFESTGEAQYVNSELVLNFLNETNIDNNIDVETSMAPEKSDLKLLPMMLRDPTGGRSPKRIEYLINTASEMLNDLAEGLENSDFKYTEPYDSAVSNVIRILTKMDFESLKKLYTEVDIGTSYRQETIRNIFHEVIPRIGTKASVFLTRYLVVENQIKSTTAIQLLMPMPFHIFELSHELVKECEVFLNLGPDRPDVRQVAVLSFATLVFNVHVAGGINHDVFDEYVQKYFNYYLNENDYEQKMLYLQGLSNLQLGNVANYLDPILKDENENQDIKFLAAWTTLPLAHTRSEKIYEIYWPIFESRNATLELRVAAVTLLLISNPTPARLISIHRIIQSETDPHMINFYRTTITSISETTYPCYQKLRRLLSYMNRHLPQKPEPRYWVTGNYVFDYRDSKFGIGAMLQAFLVGDPKSDLPVVAYLKFDTEALGKFTGQLALYIKARGLPDAFFDKFLKDLSEPLRFDNLKKLLKVMKAPLIDSKKLHFEFILQMEGKTVLSYYLNQKMFEQLTFENIVSRITFLLHTDSHINMQTVRWPFMTEYSVPTVLGTAADVFLQTTVLTSLRGNITQPQQLTLEIDGRYSSYASCRSRSYNPFLNYDHIIKREQGFSVYVPVNIDLGLSSPPRCMRYSFTRPNNMTSGLSFKSRSVTITRGAITKSSEPYEKVLFPERQLDVYQLFKYDADDLGLTFSINTNLNELIKYRSMLLKSEIVENGFSRNMIVNFLLYVFGFAQLSSIHLGHDRNFTMLVYNQNSTQINGSVCVDEFITKRDMHGRNFNFSLIHFDNPNSDIPLHNWTIQMDVVSSTKTKWFNILGNVERSSVTEQLDWKACTNMTYEPLVFAKRPHTFNGSISFGPSQDHIDCPHDGSKVVFSGRAGPSEEARAFLLAENETLTDTDYCPKEVLKFTPAPTSKFCKRSVYENFTSITHYDVDIDFDNMPEWFDLWSSRLDHIVSAISENKVKKVDMNDQMRLSLHLPNDKFWMEIVVNGVNWRIYHIPFIKKLDSKYDAFHEFFYDSGLKRSCSLINGMINSFDDYLVNLNEYHKSVSNNAKCLTLLAADCSSTPEMAVFLLPSEENGLSGNYGLRVHVGQHFFNFKPRSKTNHSTDDSVYIYLNQEETPFNIREKPYQYPLDAEEYELRVELNEQSIMFVESKKMNANIQFDMSNIVNFEVFGVYKNKMCGLCSLPLNRMEDYNLCD